MPLTGSHSEQLELALRSAFYEYSLLKMMLSHRLDKRLGNYAPEVLPLPQVVSKLVEAAEAEGWTDDLVTAAIAANPGNPDLKQFYEDVWLALAAPEPNRRALETMIRSSEKFQDVEAWIAAFMDHGRRVCCLEIAATRASTPVTLKGTGFLIGPDAIITNYHVMEPVICGADGRETTAASGVGPGLAARASDVRVRFDYRLLPDGTTLGTEQVCKLRGSTLREWLIDASPPSQTDFAPASNTTVPNDDELDYAIVRLDGAPGESRVSRVRGTSAGTRGWIPIPTTPVAPRTDQPLVILQHPEGKPLKLAFHRVTHVNKNATRVGYRVNTLGGSSGAPCFTENWDLLALHHSGDAHHRIQSNQGVTFTAIRKRLIREKVPY